MKHGSKQYCIFTILDGSALTKHLQLNIQIWPNIFGHIYQIWLLRLLLATDPDPTVLRQPRSERQPVRQLPRRSLLGWQRLQGRAASRAEIPKGKGRRALQ